MATLAYAAPALSHIPVLADTTLIPYNIVTLAQDKSQQKQESHFCEASRSFGRVIITWWMKIAFKITHNDL